ncbi:MAG: hypothetical protein QOC96_3514 [Acidobacteriota bacterium]|nr:hypothetical protein [Acidobacteriota bacterium]
MFRWMFTMKDRRQLRSEEQNQTRHVAPGQDGDDCADRAVKLIVVKVVQTPRKNVFPGFPDQTGDDRSGHSRAQSHTRVRHEAIDKRQESDCDNYAGEDEDDLPEQTAERSHPRPVLKLARREPPDEFPDGDQQRSGKHGGCQQQSGDADHAERQRASVQKGSRRRVPGAVDRAFDHGEDPGASPQDDDDARDNDANADVRKRANRRAQKLTGAGISLRNVIHHLVQHVRASRQTLAECEQQDESGKERQQTEVAHRGSRREKIVLVKLVKRMAQHLEPRRFVAHAE